MKVLIAVGGTGGHVLPALALAEELGTETLFVGSGLEENRFFPKRQYPFCEILAAPLTLLRPLQAVQNGRKLYKGFQKSKKILADFRPDVVVGFGSYHSFPILLASVMNEVPVVMHAADLLPGKVVRFFSRFAKVTGMQFPSSRSYLYENVAQVKHPLRSNFYAPLTKKEALMQLGLEEDRFTLLVFGGSQGAERLNTLVQEALPLFVRQKKWQIIHITGSLSAREECEILYRQYKVPHFVREYEERLDLAWRSADLALVRAGASTIAEQIVSEVPCIYIPYPHASEQHQDKNADFMVYEVGAAMKMKESSATKEKLAALLLRVGDEDLARMQKALRVYKQNNVADTLAELVLSAGGR